MVCGLLADETPKKAVEKVFKMKIKNWEEFVSQFCLQDSPYSAYPSVESILSFEAPQFGH